jgi:hypothetical protein
MVLLCAYFMQQRKINSTICEDELERIQEETSGPILRYCPSICLQALRKTTKLLWWLVPRKGNKAGPSQTQSWSADHLLYLVWNFLPWYYSLTQAVSTSIVLPHWFLLSGFCMTNILWGLWIWIYFNGNWVISPTPHPPTWRTRLPLTVWQLA